MREESYTLSYTGKAQVLLDFSLPGVGNVGFFQKLFLRGGGDDVIRPPCAFSCMILAAASMDRKRHLHQAQVFFTIIFIQPTQNFLADPVLPQKLRGRKRKSSAENPTIFVEKTAFPGWKQGAKDGIQKIFL